LETRSFRERRTDRVLFVDAVDVGVVERVELEVELLLAGGDAGVSDAHGRTSLYM
jgi:hypothetical protein